MSMQGIKTTSVGFRVSALALAVAASSGAWAQQAEVVDVIGQAAQLEQALDDQRKSDSIRSVVHADAIGQLPDDNAAEALQRIPGVSVERDQGEGRFVRVRGLGPDLNSVTINGTLVPSPESKRRAVALDVLPSELIQSLSVVKTLTPDMDANSVGGTIEVESMSAFDHDGLFYSLSGEVSHDDNTSKQSPKLSGAFSNRFSLGDGIDNFGVAAAISWHDRRFGSDNTETGGAWDFDGAQAALERIEQRRYDITRERLGMGLNLDYRPDDDSELYLRSLYSKFKDSESRQALRSSFSDPQLPGDTGTARLERRLKERDETQTIRSLVVGGKQSWDDWRLHAQAGHSKSSEDTPLAIGNAVFRNLSNFAGVGYQSSRKPVLGPVPGYDEAQNYRLHSVSQTKEYTEDREYNLRLALEHDYQVSGIGHTLGFGGKLSRRDKKNDAEQWSYSRNALLAEGFSDADLNLSNFTRSRVGYGLGGFGPGIRGSAVKSLLSGLERSAFYDEEASRVNDFKISEDINAAWLMNTSDIDRLRLIVGIRYEQTRFSAKGTGLDEDVFLPVSKRRNYDHWLPGLTAIYSLNANTQLRAAWTNSVVRPTFGQLAPGFVIEDNEAEFGNPELKALESSNFDIGIEHFMGRAGTVSAFAFYKDIRHFAYETDLAGTGQYIDFDEAFTFVNGDKAKVYGLELAYAQQFNWLPAPWNGLLLNANTTLTRSRAGIEQFDEDLGGLRKRNISLPGQSDLTGNLTLGWENQRLSLRLSANYKSDYLSEVGDVLDKRYDYKVDDQLFVDFSASYFLMDNLQVFFEAQNLTDESYYVYTGRKRYNAQYEEYGPTYKLGLTLTHF